VLFVTVFGIVSGVLLLIVSVLMTIVILLQQNRSEGLGSAYGDVGQFEGQRGRSLDMALSRYTKILAIAFAVLIVVSNVVIAFLK